MTKNILALIDFSETTDPVVFKAGELARLYGAKCWLLHVAAPDPEFVGYDVGPQYIRDSRADVLREEHQALQEMKARLSAQGIEAEALLVQGTLNETIMAEIEKLAADMVVLGSHGRSRLYELVVGSACAYVIKHAKVPLVVVPSRQ